MHIRSGHGLEEGLWGVLFILALFACVVLHEFGHALTARRFGALTKDITLYPIGGIASLEAMPKKPVQELQVSVAGPLVNLGIAVILWIYLKSTDQITNISRIQHISLSGSFFALNMMYANIILAIFNLIPAFPMDGGRVLRSLLAMKMDPVKATAVASRTGQFLAIVFVFVGFFYNFWLVFIGLFIFLGAGAESKAEEMKHALEGIKAGNVMLAEYTILHPDEPLQKASGRLLSSNEKSFVIMENDKVVGILDYKSIVAGLHEGKANQKIENFMQKDFIWLENDEFLVDRFLQIQSEQQSIFPVRKDGKLVGIISLDNIYKWIHTRQHSFNH